MCSRFLKLAVLLALVLSGCEKNPPPTSAMSQQGNQQSSLTLGSKPLPVVNPYASDEEALGEGKRLYNQFNCSGCHAGGGGAIGPALMDETWIYGSQPGNIYSTIVEGRPNGMPAFGGRIPEDKIWRIAAFVSTLSKPEAKP
jgi:cytochrome c oxidase cbb3-type subunit 3